MFDSEKVLETLEGMVYSSRLDRFVILCPNVTLTYTHKSSDVGLVFNVQNLEWNFFMKSQIKFLILKIRVKLIKQLIMFLTMEC